MTKRRGVVWKNFLILMSFMSVLIMLSTFLIYHGLYIVSVSELEDFNRQMRQARLNAIGIGMGCVLLACILIWIYVIFASKPIKSILNLLENPLDYHEYTNQSEQEVQEIVDRIVSNLQMNNNLRQIFCLIL